MTAVRAAVAVVKRWT